MIHNIHNFIQAAKNKITHCQQKIKAQKVKHDGWYQIFLSNFHIQEKEKKTFANMFDKFAMADKKKEALEKQVCQLWSDDCHNNSIIPVEAGRNEPYRPVELRRRGQHQHRPQQYQGIKRPEEETCCNQFYRLVEIYRWAWTSMKLSRRTSRFQPLLLKAHFVILSFCVIPVFNLIQTQVTEASGDD